MFQINVAKLKPDEFMNGDRAPSKLEIVKSFVATVDHFLVTVEDLDVFLGEPIVSIFGLDVDVRKATSVCVPEKETSCLPDFVAKVAVVSNVENVHAHID